MVVTRSLFTRTALFASVFILSVALAGTHAFAALDMVIGPHITAQNTPISDCDSRAQAALQSDLQGGTEAGTGTHEWFGHGTPDQAGHYTSAAAINCFPVGNGYSATITCTAEVPPNAETAAQICAKLATAFGTPGTSK